MGAADQLGPGLGGFGGVSLCLVSATSGTPASGASSCGPWTTPSRSPRSAVRHPRQYRPVSRRGREDDSAPSLKVSATEAEQMIARGTSEAEELLQAADDVRDAETFETWTRDCERWDARTKTALDSVFDGPCPEEFHDAATGAIFRQVGQGNDQTFLYRQEAIKRGINTLRSIGERLEFLAEPVPEAETRPTTPGGRQVFVVHGRDRALREQVARLLDRLDLEPIVLEEQAGRGRTILEKFEDHALSVGYAVVLMTADDFGRGPDEADWPENPNRARQNVVLELGYFMGALGRPRVAALLAPGVEQPSDIHGLLYISTAGAWELQLAKEMRDAGLPVDLNRL
jgi:predicted nucleotide-binding protein